MKKIEIKKILVPVDFSAASEAATLNAITLAKLLKADIFLLHVIEFNDDGSSFATESKTIPPSFSDYLKKMNELQEKIKKQFDITPESFTIRGQVDAEIINFSIDKQIDLIVMGADGISGADELFTGSNAQRVVTLSEVPVLTLQANNKQPRFKNILIPIDNSTHSREKINLAMIIADLFDAKIHIIGLPDSENEQDLNKFKIKCESLEKIIHANNLPYITTIIHGENLAESAINYATKNNCDLIIISTGHESKLTGIFLGAFAQQIVNHSKIPVLSYKHTKDDSFIDVPGYGVS